MYFPPLFLYSTVAHCTVLVCHIKSRKRAHEVWDSDKSFFVFFLNSYKCPFFLLLFCRVFLILYLDGLPLGFHGYPAVVGVVWEALPAESLLQLFWLQEKPLRWLHGTLHLLKARHMWNAYFTLEDAVRAVRAGVLSWIHLLLRNPRVFKKDEPNLRKCGFQLLAQSLQLLAVGISLAQVVGAKIHHRNDHLGGGKLSKNSWEVGR